MAEPSPPPGVSPEDLARLMDQVEAEEMASDDARLASIEGFELWVRTHPALSQAVFVENLAQIGPAILQFLRAMIGL